MKIKSAGVKVLLIVYVFILAVVIFTASQKGTRYWLSFTGDIPYGDKIGHFLLMGGFSFLLNMVLNARNFRFGKIDFLLGSLTALVIVTAEEISQIFVAGRTFDWSDLIFDFWGIFVFGELAKFICRRET